MPSKKQYDLVQNDDYDTRIPLHSDEAFQHGICFQAKYIGTLEVPRPTSRVEIVAAMRRIRYDFKARNIKKKKVSVEISVDGVRVTLRKKKKKKPHPWLDDRPLELMSHPIYRIFYVSHDSSDLKIFSYIARDGATDVFKCSVFKSNKKSQAMRIVRTVGQAFEVCHKLSVNEPTPEPLSDAEDSSSEQEPYGTPEPADIRDKGEKETKDMIRERDRDREIIREKEKEREDIIVTPDDSKTTVSTPAERPKRLDLLPPPPSSSRRSPAKNDSSPLVDTSTTTVPLAAHHELQLLREKLEQQAQQTRHASAQLIMLRDQLAAETAARVEAQTRTQQLLVHNRELLDHIAALVAHLQDSERTGTGLPSVTMVPQVSMQQYHHAPETGTPIDAPDNLMGLGAPPSSPNRKTFHQQQNNNNNNNVASPSAGNPGNNLQGNQGTGSGNSPNNSLFSFNFPTTEQIYSRLQIHPNPYHQFHQQQDLYPYNVFANQNLLNNYNNLLQHPSPGQLAPSPIGFNRLSQQSSYSNSPILSRSDPEESDLGSDEPAFIRPLSQVGTLTTMDSDGRVRVIVPVNEDARGNSGNKDKKLGSSGGLPSMVTLRITDEGGNNITKTNTFITRPTSDKSVHKNRSAESIQRNAWARHTTK